MSPYQLMSWPALWLPTVQQEHTDTVLDTGLSACFEMDAHDLPVMIKIFKIIGIQNKMVKQKLIFTKNMIKTIKRINWREKNRKSYRKSIDKTMKNNEKNNEK